MESTDSDSIFQEHGKASQLQQYIDITIRNMEAITLAAVLRRDINFGSSNSEMYLDLKEFYRVFVGLYEATNLETEKHLNGSNKSVKSFIEMPFSPLPAPVMNDNRNRGIMITALKNAIEQFEVYEKALKDAGFRKISYLSLKKEHKALENR